MPAKPEKYGMIFYIKKEEQRSDNDINKCVRIEEVALLAHCQQPLLLNDVSAARLTLATQASNSQYPHSSDFTVRRGDMKSCI